MHNLHHTSLKTIKVLGLMTGSSADGLDICLVKFTGEDSHPQYEIQLSTEIPYPSNFGSAFRNPLELDEAAIQRLDTELGIWFAKEVSKLNLDFDLVASHGQTIKHEPPHFTLQIGNPKFLADSSGRSVIYDFRTADIKQGGQGAPLIPIVDQYLFQTARSDTLALNIGGIANLTVVPAKQNPVPLLAWDTGPGNTLIDKAVRLYTKDKLSYDPEGSIAAQGKLNEKLIEYLLEHEFYQTPPPRSAGQEQFGKTYFNTLLSLFYPNSQQEFKDFIFTLTVLTSRSIAQSITQLPEQYSPTTMFIGGGGYFNKTLIGLIKSEVPDIDVKGVDLHGITVRNKEAFGFAYLGYLHNKKLPGNITSVTGARQEIVLGNTILPQK